MLRLLWIVPGLVGTLLVAGSPALACSLCSGSPQTTLSMRQEMAQAKLVLYGTLANPRLNPGGTGGTTDLQIERVLKNDPFLGNKKVIELPRYVPVDAKNPPRFLVFCDVYNGKFDPYRGVPVKSAAVVDYLKGTAALDPKDRSQALQYYFRYLDHADPDVSNDAFVEFAKATDSEVGQVAGKLSAAKLRTWLQDPQTPANRLSLYAFMLGACGSRDDAVVLRDLLDRPTERTLGPLGGILAGYIQLQPDEGWKRAHGMLRDAKRPFGERFAVLGTLRFYHGWKADQSRREVVRGLAELLPQGDIADLAIEDLRRWQIWDLTTDVLAQYGKKSHDAPIMTRTIIRYALCCPQAEAVRFINERRKQDPGLIKEVEEGLQFEKK